MTLIVGVLCEDGIVVGADGAATLGSLGSMTARQPVKKLTNVQNRVVIGVSGPVGLGQLLIDRVESLQSSGGLKGTKCPNAAQAMRIFTGAFKDDVIPAFDRARVAAGVVGNQNAAARVMSSTVVALTIKSQPVLIQFDEQCGAEAATPDLPFVAVGSGQATADPFLAFVRRVFWVNRLPTVSEGILAATWTLRQAIETSPGGVADPIQLMVLEGGEVRELSDPEREEHEQSANALEEHIARYGQEMKEASTEDVEAPPEA
jgi:20S proteasome alpha/beta subunit